MQFTGERVIEGDTPKRIWLDHIARYEFASSYVKGKNVLDLSCGTGYGSKILCDAGAKKVIGVDISGEAIDFSRTKYKKDRLEFKIGDILKIEFPDSYFEVVVSFETIEHVSNQKKALLEIRRVLKPDGLLIISSPNRKMTSPFKSFDELPENPFHIVEYTMKEFIQLLGNYFKVVEVYGQRGISKLFFLPFLESKIREILPVLYAPEKGKPELEKVSFKKEYRYITAICKKSKNDKS